MWFLTSVLSALLFGFAGFSMKYGTHVKASSKHVLLGLYLSGSVGFSLWTTYRGQWEVSLSLLLAGIIVGIGSAFGNELFMKALRLGPASLTSPLVNMNIVIVVFLSLIAYKESLSFTESVAVILLIISVMLLPFDPNESLAIRNRRWYMFVFAAIIIFALRNGGLKVTEEMLLPGSTILFYAYAFSALFFYSRIRIGDKPVLSASRAGLRIGLAGGCFSFLGMQLYAYSLQIGPGSIVAPIFSTNSLVVALLSILWLKERLSLYQGIALFLLFLGLILLKI